MTLRDIAREANLSVSAVSKALADYPQVNEATRRRVLRISEQLNYKPRLRGRVGTPNLSAAAGVPGERRSAGLVLFETHPANENSTRWLTLLTEAAEDRRLRLELCALTRADAIQNRAGLKGRVAHLGAVLLFGCVSLPVIQALRDLNLACIVLGDIEGGHQSHPLPCHLVTSDKVAMGELATRTLIEAGHRRIGFFCASYPRGGWNDQWLTGYRLAMMHAGLDADPQIHPVFEDGDRDEVGVAAAEHMAALDRPPTAYVVPTIRGAARFLDTLKLRGIELGPHQIVMGGQASDGFASQATYGLEGYPLIGEDPAILTRAAVDLLSRVIEGASPPLAKLTVPHHVRNLPGSAPPA